LSINAAFERDKSSIANIEYPKPRPNGCNQNVITETYRSSTWGDFCLSGLLAVGIEAESLSHKTKTKQVTSLRRSHKKYIVF